MSHPQTLKGKLEIFGREKIDLNDSTAITTTDMTEGKILWGSTDGRRFYYGTGCSLICRKMQSTKS